MNPILELEKVVKAYQNHLAVDEVSFQVPKQSIFGLLGPNGAGKTTLIRIITTIIQADSGQIRLDGEVLNNSHPEEIGYMPEERGLYRKMKVGEHLLYLARLKGLPKQKAHDQIQFWMEKFDILDWKPKKVEELSKGMQQKIQFIATVIHQPKVIILDEPFSGLDPVNTNLIKAEIQELRKNGASIIFSTHRMEQVEEICEHIVLINNGKNVLEGKVKDIKNQFKRSLFQLDFEGELSQSVLSGLSVLEQHPGRLIFQLSPEQDSNQVLRDFLKEKIHILEFKELLPSLNEIFIRQVGDPAVTAKSF
jgi:ABC-2 type transport system ATP-binding protein